MTMELDWNAYKGKHLSAKSLAEKLKSLDLSLSREMLQEIMIDFIHENMKDAPWKNGACLNEASKKTEELMPLIKKELQETFHLDAVRAERTVEQGKIAETIASEKLEMSAKDWALRLLMKRNDTETLSKFCY